MASPRAMKGISRIDSDSTHGWVVRGYRNGKTYSKLFSDRKLGGKGKSQKLAKAYRDELNAELEAIPKAPNKRRIGPQDSHSNTGELGVSRAVKNAPNGITHECYSVSWRPEPHIQKSTTFSIKKYGEKSRPSGSQSTSAGHVCARSTARTSTASSQPSGVSSPRTEERRLVLDLCPRNRTLTTDMAPIEKEAS